MPDRKGHFQETVLLHLMEVIMEVIRAERIIIAINAWGLHCKVMQVFFGRSDGSIYINFPYYRHAQGLLSLYTLKAGVRGVPEADLVPTGKVTSHLAKYSHHPDGRAHFSQAGKVKAIVGKRALPLSEAEIHLFTSQLQGLGSFDAIDPKTDTPGVNPQRTVVTLQLPTLTLVSEAVKLVGWWYHENTLNQKVVGKVRGPFVPAITADGRFMIGVLVGAPAPYPLSEHVLMVTAGIVPKLNDDPTTLSFIGGFDHPSVVKDIDQSTSMLAFVYPEDKHDQLIAKIGSADIS